MPDSASIVPKLAEGGRNVGGGNVGGSLKLGVKNTSAPNLALDCPGSHHGSRSQLVSSRVIVIGPLSRMQGGPGGPLGPPEKPMLILELVHIRACKPLQAVDFSRKFKGFFGRICFFKKAGSGWTAVYSTQEGASREPIARGPGGTG